MAEPIATRGGNPAGDFNGDSDQGGARGSQHKAGVAKHPSSANNEMSAGDGRCAHPGQTFLAKERRPESTPASLAARLIAAADRARGARDWANAALLYQQALTVDPGLTAIWVQLGHALKEQGDRAGAEAAYRRSLALNDGISDTHLQLGHVLKMQGHRSDAAKAYFTALRLDPAASDPRLELRGLGYSDDEITVAVTTGFLLSA